MKLFIITLFIIFNYVFTYSEVEKDKNFYYDKARNFYYSNHKFKEDSASFYFQKFINSNPESSEKLIYAYYSRADTYTLEGDYYLSINLLLKAIEVYRINNIELDMSHIYLSLIANYINLEEYDKTQEFFDILIHSNLVDKEQKMATYVNYGIYLLTKEKNDSAKYYLEKTINYKGSSHYLGYTVINLTSIYNKDKAYQKSLDLLENASRLITNDNYPNKVLLYFANLETYQMLNDKTKEKFYINKIKEFEVSSSSDIKLKIYQILSQFYTNSKEYKKATKYYTKYINKQKKMFNKDNRELLTKYEVKYNLLKKQLKNEELESQINYLIIITIISLILIIVIFIYWTKQKKYTKDELHKVESLKLIKTELEKNVNAKDKLFEILSHDLKNPLTGITITISNLINYHKKNDNLDEKQLRLANRILKASDSMKITIEDIFMWASAQSGVLKSHPEPEVNIFENLSIENDLLLNNIQNKDIHFEFKIDKDIVLENCDPNLLKTVYRNILSNAIKFTNESGKIQIKLGKNNNRIAIIIKDNGVGMSSKTLNSIFDMAGISMLGTNNEKGTGLGLITCKNLQELNGGEIEIHSNIGHGTTVEMLFHIN